MSKKTLQERFAEALTNLGQREVKRTFKYIVFSRTSAVPNGKKHYYLGRAGSLRVGDTTAGSIPVSNLFKEYLLATEGKCTFKEWRLEAHPAQAILPHKEGTLG